MILYRIIVDMLESNIWLHLYCINNAPVIVNPGRGRKVAIGFMTGIYLTIDIDT